ncbi:unnamed protein product [Kuraishia capsulata CBS 1993]|uniref:Peroxidase n=1 Tax=Kuraishia capsulata CBS 1993 TaxID=1382522 RepID=W6MJ03_9ASCO|nr:uncharacterized protein KUCA_T00000344001 [Kuraishia capsulata CBS 1993]CDK24382.1 unnamed protein product [Kuraishia capsulata CBS 1993]
MSVFLPSLKFRANPRLVGSLVGGAITLAFINDQSNRQSGNNGGNNSRLSKAGLFGFGAANARIAGKPEKSQEDYQKVYNQIAGLLQEKDEYDDGSYGPVLVRLAWHASGTYDKSDKSETKGGSYGGTMRFAKEAGDEANNGLINAREFLKDVQAKNPWISHGDLWTLGGVVAIQEMNGPKIKWRPGRQDLAAATTPPAGRLPDASRDAPYVRGLFNRMGFEDEEIVALIGAHCLGRCHTQNSGYEGPWTFSPTQFTNEFFRLLVEEKWHIRKWDGPTQYEDDATNSLMMLPADMALIEDARFKKYVVRFAKDQDDFFKVFSSTFQRLLELGVDFPAGSPEYTFKTLDEQE